MCRSPGLVLDCSVSREPSLRLFQAERPVERYRPGAAAGLLSGAGGALVYALYCPEMAAPFIGIWYLLGMLIPATVGAMLGPRLLRC